MRKQKLFCNYCLTISAGGIDYYITGTVDKRQDSKECTGTASSEVQTSSSDSRGLLNYICTLSVSIFIIHVCRYCSRWFRIGASGDHC